MNDVATANASTATPAPNSGPQVRTLLLTDLCDSTLLVERLGDGPAADLFRAAGAMGHGRDGTQALSKVFEMLGGFRYHEG